MVQLIERVSVSSCPRRLRVPLQTAAGSWQVLPGVAVELLTSDGMRCEGEAPFLVASDADIALCCERARAHTAGWIGRTAAEARCRFDVASPGLAPTLAWALDTALRSAETDGNPLSRAGLPGNGEAPLDSVRTNALVGAARLDELAREVASLVAAGEHTLKLKVGLGELAEDVDRVAAVREAAGPRTVLRLDANAAWDEAEARRRLAAFERFEIAYVEQPVAAHDVAALSALRRDALVPVAADEAARDEAGANAVLAAAAADVLVLKPAALGPATTTARLITRAHDAGIEVVLSSLYDGAVSLWASIGLAAALRLESAHGLATGQWLAAPGAAPVPVRGVVVCKR